MEFIRFIFQILKRPKMHYIQKIEDFYYLINGYIAGKDDENLYIFINEFSEYLSNKYNFKIKTSYSLIIRSTTIYDEKTLELLKIEIINFIKDNNLTSIKYLRKFNKDDINKLILEIE